VVKVNGTSVPALGIMKMISQQEANDNPLNMYYSQFWLSDSGYIGKPRYNKYDGFPLGLYISDTVAAKLQFRATQLDSVDKALMDSLKYYFRK
jgi:hypothetical protein